MAGGLFSGSSTTTTGLPEWVVKAGEENYGISKDIAAGKWPDTLAAYPKYTGERVAGFTGDETDAMGRMRALVGGAGPAFTAARTAVDRGGATARPMFTEAADMARGAGGRSAPRFTEADMSEYANPYMEAALDEIRRSGAIARNDMAAKAGSQWGGSRSAVLEGMQREGETRALADARMKAHELGAQNFWRDVAQSNTEAGRDLTVANTLATLGKEGYAVDADTARLLASLGLSEHSTAMSDIAALYGIGQDQRKLAQQKLDVPYQDYVEARDWPQRMLNMRMSALTGTPYERTQVQDTSGNIASQLAGLGMSAYGLWNMFKGMK